MDFDGMAEVDGVASYRVLITSGVLVRAYAVWGVLLTDESVELVAVTIDP